MENKIKSFFKKFKKDRVSNPPRDPVCGMKPTEGIDFVHEGIKYSFCSDHCKQQFEKDPTAFITK